MFFVSHQRMVKTNRRLVEVNSDVFFFTLSVGSKVRREKSSSREAASTLMFC